VRYALITPNWAPYDQDLMIRLALECEQLGFERIFFTDHLMNPYHATDGYAEETVETWALISYLAGRTETIRLGTAVTPMALRPPALVAKQVATIDRLSGGRIDFGIGTGWSSGSFGVIDTDFGDPASRKARLREGIEMILHLWHEDEVDFQGEYYAAHNAVIGPKPLQKPHPPLWIGGWRQNMLTITAELGDGWIPWNRTVEFYGDALRQIREQAEPLGRADEITYGTAVLVVPDSMAGVETAMSHSEQPNVTPSTLAQWSERYEEAGAEVLAMLVFPPEEALDVARFVARELM
jgi:probable F420-dependent oxidoreductase